MGTEYSTEAISGYNATPPADDGTVSENNKVKWSTIKTKLPDPLKTAIEGIDTKLVAHFDRGPTALTTNTTLGASHFNKIVQVSGSGVTLTLTDAATLTSGWYCDIVSTDTTNNVTLARATASNMINETSADVTILPLQELRVIVNAAANGFLVNSKGRHSKSFKTAEDYTHAGTVTMSGKSIYAANASVAANATTSNIWSGGNYVTLTGTAVTFTDFADAPQAGVEVELYCNAAHVFTDNANLEVDGSANFTAEVGDRVLVRSKSTTVFTLRPIRQAGPGSILQVVHYDTGAVATGTGTIPNDDTIPQNTEGDEYMTLAITPKSANSTLVVDVCLTGSTSSGGQWCIAVFRDSTANAIGAAAGQRPSVSAILATVSFSVKAAANAATSTTFKVRAGDAAAGTTTLNGVSGGRIFGGICSSSIRITEIAA